MRGLACAIAAIAGCSNGSAPTLSAQSRCEDVSMVELAPVQLGQSARRIIVFTNTGGATADGLAATLDGP